MNTIAVNVVLRTAGLARRAGLYCFPWALVLLLLTQGGRCAGAAVVYSTGFEASEGYNLNLDLVGQKGWVGYGSGGNGVLTNVFAGRGQHAYVGYAPPSGNDNKLFVYQPINKSLPRVQFSVQMSIFDSSTTNRDNFYWGVFNQQGDQLFLLDFDNYDTNIYYWLEDLTTRYWTGSGFSNETNYLLSMDLDFANNRWSAKLNKALLATNQPITTLNSPLNLGDIDAGWIVYDISAPGDNFMAFDDYLLTATLSPPQISVTGMAGSTPTLRLTGVPDMSFAIEASTNLTSWLPLKTNVTTGGYFDYVDSGAAGKARRFYRGRWVP